MKTFCLGLLLQTVIPQSVSTLDLNEKVWLGLQGIDCVQTREIITNPNFSETNLVLKNRINLLEVDAYFIVTSVIIVAFKRLLPKRHQSVFMHSIQGMSFSYVSGNMMAGVGVKF